MNKTEGANLRVILYEGAGSQPMDAEDRFKAISALLDNGFEVTRPAEGGAVTREDDSPLLVLGKFEAGRPPQAEGLSGNTVHFRDFSPDTALETAKKVRDSAGARKLEAWKPVP